MCSTLYYNSLRIPSRELAKSSSNPFLGHRVATLAPFLSRKIIRDVSKRLIRSLCSSDCFKDTNSSSDQKESKELQTEEGDSSSAALVPSTGVYRKAIRVLGHRTLSPALIKPRLQCSICPATFDREYSLKLHENVHQRLFVCRICERALESKVALETHERLQHFNERMQLVCPLCYAMFETEAQLSYHRSFVPCDRHRKDAELFPGTHTRNNLC